MILPTPASFPDGHKVWRGKRKGTNMYWTLGSGLLRRALCMFSYMTPTRVPIPSPRCSHLPRQHTASQHGSPSGCLIPLSYPGQEKLPCSSIILIISVPFSSPQNVSWIRTPFKPFNNWSQILNCSRLLVCFVLTTLPAKQKLLCKWIPLCTLLIHLVKPAQEFWLVLLSLQMGIPHLSDILGNKLSHKSDLHKLISHLPEI